MNLRCAKEKKHVQGWRLKGNIANDVQSFPPWQRNPCIVREEVRRELAKTQSEAELVAAELAALADKVRRESFSLRHEKLSERNE